MMHNENDRLIEQMREEANQFLPPFSMDLHERLVTRLKEERAALVRSRKVAARFSTYCLIPWLAVAAVGLIAVTAYFAASRFVHRDVRSTRTFAKVEPISPGSSPAPLPASKPIPQSVTLPSENTIEVPKAQSAQLPPVAVRPVTKQPVAGPQGGVIQPILKQPLVMEAAVNKAVVIKPAVERPPVVQVTVARPVVTRSVIPQPITLQPSSQVVAIQQPSRRQSGPVAGVIRNLDHIVLTLPVKVLPAADRHVVTFLDSAIADTFNTVSNQMGNIFDGLLQPFESRR